jgi:hypothetical protein
MTRPTRSSLLELTRARVLLFVRNVGTKFDGRFYRPYSK